MYYVSHYSINTKWPLASHESAPLSGLAADAYSDLYLYYSFKMNHVSDPPPPLNDD